ncbi:MAG: hypothetical protein ACYCZO_02910 [Daejeonella sp.]
MTTLTINIPESAKARIERYILSLGGEVLTASKLKTKLPIEELEEALLEVKAMEEGTMPKRSLREALRG